MPRMRGRAVTTVVVNEEYLGKCGHGCKGTRHNYDCPIVMSDYKRKNRDSDSYIKQPDYGLSEMSEEVLLRADFEA